MTHRVFCARLLPFAALAGALAVAGPAPVSAQTVLERYEAVIGDEDRRNSSGTPLEKPAQILAQDRANVHRFGIRHPGDSVDRFFADRTNRAQFERLLAAGGMGAGVEAAILGGGASRLVVEVIGQGGRADRVSVSLAGTAGAPLAQTATGAPPAAAVSAAARWTFGTDDRAAIGSADGVAPSGLAATLRCYVGQGAAAETGQGGHVASVAAAGVATLMISPALMSTGPGEPISLGVDGTVHLTRRFVMAQPEGALAAQILLDSPFIDALRGGRTFEITAGPQRAEVALSGSSASLAALRDYCAAAAPDPASIPRPGFDCTRAGTATERALCTDPDLAALDQAMNAAMARAVAQAPSAREAQRSWLAQRDGCGADATCLSSAISTQTAQLEAVAAGTLPAGQMASAAPTTPPAGGGLPGFGSAPAAQSQTGIAQFAPAPVGQTTFAAPTSPQTLNQTLNRTTGQTTDQTWAQTPNQSPALTLPPAASNAEQVQVAAALWILGQRPRLAEGLWPFTGLWQAAEMPAGYPALAAIDVFDQERATDFLQQVAARAVSEAPPGDLVMDVNVQLRQNARGVAELSLPYTFNIGLTGTEVPTIRTLVFELPMFGRNQHMQLVESQAFPLPVPEGLLQRLGPNAPLTLRLAGRLQDQRILFPSGSTRITMRPGVSATFEIGSATLLSEGVPVHSWARPDGAGDLARFDMTSVEGIADLYGGQVEDGRLLVGFGGLDDRLGLSRANGHLVVNSDYSQAARAADLAMRLAFLLRAFPERTLAPDLVAGLSTVLLTPLERAMLFPPEYESGQMNEIARARLLEEVEPALRRIVLERAPQPPVRVRAIQWTSIGEYDRRTQGFALPGLNMNNFGWLPFAGTSAGMRGMVDAVPDMLAMPEEQAIAVLDQLPGNRQIAAQFDYDVTVAGAAVPRGGPITEAELGAIRASRIPRTLSFFATPDRAAPMMTVSFAPPEGDAAASGGAVPEAALLTTGGTLLAAAERLPGGEGVLEEALGSRRDLSRSPASVRAARIADIAAEIRARTPERFWIGAVLGLRPYDAEAGGYPIAQLNFVPVAHQTDIDGIDPPVLAPADGADFAVLPVPPESRDIVQALLEEGRQNLTVLFEVGLTGAYDRRKVQITRPSRALIGPRTPNDGIASVALEIPYGDKPTLETAADAKGIAPPDALLLTPEAADLLAISLQPALLDDAALARMMRERLALERGAAEAGYAPQWGAFFADPALPLTDDALQALMPAFRAWTEARVAALPDVLLLPLAENGRFHPETGCTSVAALFPPQADLAVSANSAALLGAEAATLQSSNAMLSSAEIPRPGADTVFVLSGRPSHGEARRSTLCPGHGQVAGPDTGAAPYADLAVVARGLPVLGRLPDRFAAANVRLENPTLRFAPLSPGQRDRPGLAGAVVVDGTVTGVDIWTASSWRVPATQTLSLAPEDWNAALGAAPENHDIVGLTLDMTLEDYLARVAERLPAALRFDAGASDALYGRGVALADPESGETFLAIPATEAADAPLLAIGRSLRFAPGAVGPDALRRSLTEKYGAPVQEADYGGTVLVWGVPDASMDRWGICGGVAKFARGARPAFAPDDPRFPPLFWDRIGWPEVETNPDALSALVHCGAAVSAIIREDDDATRLTVWIYDEGRARALHDQAAADAPPPADLELDL